MRHQNWNGSFVLFILFISVFTASLIPSCAGKGTAPSSVVNKAALPKTVQTERTVECADPEQLWLVCRDVLLEFKDRYASEQNRFFIYTRDLSRLNFVAYKELSSTWREKRRTRIELSIQGSQMTGATTSCTVLVRLIPEQRLLSPLSWYEWTETTDFAPEYKLAEEILDAIERKLKSQ